MKWKHLISKFNGKMTKETWLLLLLLGVFLMILSIPAPGKKIQGEKQETGQKTGEASGPAEVSQASASPSLSYENGLEKRIGELLKTVDGVGKVEVMVVLKSSSEKVMRVDKTQSLESTSEKDSSGGERAVSASQSGESTVLSGSGGSGEPIVEKELSPEISGIIISAQGGGAPVVQAEISQAMEALFGLPPHKIKVLKRVE